MTILHTCTIQKARAAFNRLHIFFHSSAIILLFYYRLSHFTVAAAIPWALITSAELIFSFIWILTQSFRWLPVVRKVFPQKLNKTLPGIDVFICTADPTKEPVVEVMNTVISALALDYPTDKLAVYLSDDGGSPLTRYAIREAVGFAKIWAPFCRKYMIKTRCPEAFFSPLAEERMVTGDDGDFITDQFNNKCAYKKFKKNVENKAGELKQLITHDRPSHIEVIHENKGGNEENINEQEKLPLLVYVSRERRPSSPHRFKAGALNALLRVSGIMSNGPYVLVLDCDMYCNDATSARQAMCFHLDEKMSSSLAFVQYPQIFHNVGKNDIYDGQARSAYKTKWQGMDGLRGPLFTGTGYYLKRKALYGYPNREDIFLGDEAEKNFGWSSKLINSLKGENIKKSHMEEISYETLQESKKLASCTFEEGTQWGKEVGYSYYCLLESTFTGYLLHCKGWKSVYLYPNRPCFLGCAPIDMKDALVQQMKWSSGLLQVGVSKFSPLTYGISRMSTLQSMCYGYFTLVTLNAISLVIYGIVPQLCFLVGVPVYPNIRSPWFAVFTCIYSSALIQHLYEVRSSGGSIKTWCNEQRMWVIRLVTGCLFGVVDFVMNYLGLSKAKFRLTNKAMDKEKVERYEKGKFNLDGAEVFMVPMTLLVVVNMVSLVGGFGRMVLNWDGGLSLMEMFGQVIVCCLGLVISYPVLEGILLSKK